MLPVSPRRVGIDGQLPEAVARKRYKGLGRQRTGVGPHLEAGLTRVGLGGRECGLSTLAERRGYWSSSAHSG